MSKAIKLTAEYLKLNLEYIPQFNSTEDFEPYDKVIGQKRAAESIELGLNMESKQYNIFIAGETGTGKTGYIVKKIEEHAKDKASPEDWCYVYNFEDSNNPIALALGSGTAIQFKEDVASLIKYVSKEAPIYFNSENYENEKNSIVDVYEKQLLALTRELSSKSKKYGFNVKQASTGEFVFIPVKEDKEMTSEDYDLLEEEEKERIEDSVAVLRNVSNEMIKQTRILNKKMEEELKQLDDKIAESIISPRIHDDIGFSVRNLTYSCLKMAVSSHFRA